MAYPLPNISKEVFCLFVCFRSKLGLSERNSYAVMCYQYMTDKVYYGLYAAT